MLSLFPDSAAVAGGELAVGGIAHRRSQTRHGTPLVVYCEQTLRTRAGAYRKAAGDAAVLYSVKAFPNVAVLRVFAEEGLGAEASTLGELAFARRAGIGARTSCWTATTKRTRSSLRAPRRAASSCSTLPTTPSARQPPACAGCSCA